MRRKEFERIKRHMLACMEDAAHDSEHVERVLAHALRIARTEAQVDMDVLIAACLLHDIGRAEQLADPSVCHAQAGARKAQEFLLREGYTEAFAQAVAACIRTHRYRAAFPPQTLEAKILFDADKLDAAGVTGVARTLLYQGQMHTPLYVRGDAGEVMDASEGCPETFFHEYKFKLGRLYDKFYTQEARRIAQRRKEAAAAFYAALLNETNDTLACGAKLLAAQLEEEAALS